MRNAIARATGLLLPWFVACSGSGKPAVSSPSTTSSSSASAAPMAFAPSGSLFALDAHFKSGPCSVTLSASPGSTYEPAAADRDRAIQSLRECLASCFQRTAGMQGTLYVSSRVDAAGKLSDSVPTPGGAIASDLATCVGGKLDTLTLPDPARGPSDLLVLVVSSCSE